MSQHNVEPLCSIGGSDDSGSKRGPRPVSESRTRLYQTWCHMKARCATPSNVAYSYYGGRGISVCQEWRESFSSFKEWALQAGYRDDLELDRKDPNGNYEPANCRWANRVQQMRNQRKRRDAKTSRFKGVSWCANVCKWRVQLHSFSKPIHCGLFLDEIQAAKQYDKMALKFYGEFAQLNFPGSPLPREQQRTLF